MEGLKRILLMKRPVPLKGSIVLAAGGVLIGFAIWLWPRNPGEPATQDQSRQGFAETPAMPVAPSARDENVRPVAQDGSKEGRLALAASLHNRGYQLLNGHSETEAAASLAEAYQIRREILGPYHADTYQTLQHLARQGWKRGCSSISTTQERTNALVRLYELRTATTNVFQGKKAQELMMDLQGGIVSLLDWLGQKEEKKLAQADWYRIEGLSEEQIAERIEGEAQGAAMAQEFAKFTDPMIAYAKSNYLAMARRESRPVMPAPASADVSTALMQRARLQLEEVGYSQEQRQILERLHREQIAWQSKYAESIARGTMTASDWATRPTLMSLGITNTIAPTNLQRGMHMQNVQRRGDARLAVSDPTSYKTLGERFLNGVQQTGNVEWVERRWKDCNQRFESGDGLGKLLRNKRDHGELTDVPADAELKPEVMALMALNFKGLLLERELRLQRALSSSSVPEVVEWRGKIRESELAGMGAADEAALPTGAISRDQVRRFANALKRHAGGGQSQRHYRSLGLALPGTGRQEMARPEAVSDALPSGSALVELLSFVRDAGGTNELQRHYGAAILAKGLAPKWVSLGPADPIDALCRRYVGILRTSPTAATSRQADDDLQQVLESLYAAVWSNVEGGLAGVTNVFLVPDGELHRISFPTMMRNGDFLSSTYQFRYLTGGRDLLADAQIGTASRAVEIWADPDFGNTGWRAGVLHLPPLPATRHEATVLVELARRHPALEVRTHYGPDVTQRNLSGVDRPLVLHLGTHGFYLPLERKDPVAPRAGGEVQDEAILVEPLYRCGIALAGANSAMHTWQVDRTFLPKEDPYFVTAEAAQLNLQGTWLVTLAACDTGVGGVNDGEGVLCLKLGFLQAGAQNVLHSLWPIDSSYTSVFLRGFYEEAFASGDAAAALSTVQARELKKLSSRPRGVSLLERVRCAGAFAVVSRGQVKHPTALTSR